MKTYPATLVLLLASCQSTFTSTKESETDDSHTETTDTGISDTGASDTDDSDMGGTSMDAGDGETDSGDSDTGSTVGDGDGDGDGSGACSDWASTFSLKTDLLEYEKDDCSESQTGDPCPFYAGYWTCFQVWEQAKADLMMEGEGCEGFNESFAVESQCRADAYGAAVTAFASEECQAVDALGIQDDMEAALGLC